MKWQNWDNIHSEKSIKLADNLDFLSSNNTRAYQPIESKFSCASYSPGCPKPDIEKMLNSIAPDKLIYLDNNSTHPILNEVKKSVIYAMDNYANPSSNHYVGQKARLEIENVRSIIAKYLNVEEHTILFTSGGTESNNIILKSNNFNCYGTEHKSALKSAKHIIKNNITKRCNLSIMAVNNETGIISDLSRYESCIDLYHSDMCQALGKLPKETIKDMIKYVDFASFSGHKIGALPGVGFIYVKDRNKLSPLFQGGNQEFLLRPGTYNYIGIVSLGQAINALDDNFITKMMNIRKYTESKLENNGYIINFKKYDRVCNTISAQIPNINSKDLTEKLSKLGIYISYGSACNSHDKSPSYVLTTMGLTEQEANSTIRISINRFTTKKEIDIFIQEMK